MGSGAQSSGRATKWPHLKAKIKLARRKLYWGGIKMGFYLPWLRRCSIDLQSQTKSFPPVWSWVESKRARKRSEPLLSRSCPWFVTSEQSSLPHSSFCHTYFHPALPATTDLLLFRLSENRAAKSTGLIITTSLSAHQDDGWTICACMWKEDSFMVRISWECSASQITETHCKY